jgi:hypothetical protein
VSLLVSSECVRGCVRVCVREREQYNKTDRFREKKIMTTEEREICRMKRKISSIESLD